MEKLHLELAPEIERRFICPPDPWPPRPWPCPPDPWPPHHPWICPPDPWPPRHPLTVPDVPPLWTVPDPLRDFGRLRY